MIKLHIINSTLRAALAVSLLTAACASHAAIISGGSEGEALRLDVAALGTSLLTAGLPTSQSGNYPGNYDTSAEVLSANVTGNAIVLGLNAGVLKAAASGNSGMVTGSSAIDRVAVTAALNALGLANLGLGLNVGQLGSTSTVADNGTKLATTAVSYVTDLDLSVLLKVLGISTNISLLTNLNLDSNTLGFNYDVFDHLNLGAIANSLGLSLIFNEKIDNCNADATQCSVETNALHLDVRPLGLADADLILGHSSAYATAQYGSGPNGVPEPGVLALLGLGLCAIAWARRRSSTAART